jgi:hypothetical protein
MACYTSSWSSVFAIPKSLYDYLDLPPIEKCDIEWKLADCSIASAHGRFNNVLAEFHMIFVHVDFIIMDMEDKNHSPIILGRPFLRTTCAIINAKKGNMRFQFPHKKCMDHFPRKKEEPKNCPHVMCTS